MENQITPDKKQPVVMKMWQFLFLLAFSLFGTGFIGYIYNDSLEKERQAHAKTQEQLNKELLGKTSCIATKDSLFTENKRLSAYKALTVAMIHRDEAAALLPYKEGQTAHLKRDSSRVTITGVFVGGNKYSYTVQYSIEYPDGKKDFVDPTLVY